MARNQLRLLTLGSFSLLDPPTIAAAKLGVKERGFLGLLAVNVGSELPRDHVAALLWGDSDERRARHSLNQSLSTLKKALPGWIESDRFAVRLKLPKSAIDLHRARMLAEDGAIDDAIGLLRGRFLADVHTGMPEFEDWKDSVNFDFYNQVELKALAVLAQPASYPLAQRYDWTRQYLAAIPWSESLKQLEIDLLQQVRNGIVAPLPKTSETHPAGYSTLRFLGRREELNVLLDAWDKARTQSGHFVLVDGNAGVGKSRLLEEFISRLRGEVTVIDLRCFEPERHIGFNIVVDLIAAISESTLRSLPPVFASALGDLVGKQYGSSPSIPELSTLGSQRRLFEALVRALDLESTRAPLLITVDDFHWADRSTMGFLHLLARRVNASRALIIAAGRSAKRTRSFRTAKSVTHLQLRELRDTEIESLRTDPTYSSWWNKDVTRRVMRMTGGNAFLLTEYLRTHREGGELSVRRRMLSSHGTRDFISRILTGLPSLAAQVVAALAVLGRPISSDFLRKLAGVPSLEFARATQHLVNRQILVVGRFISFRHDLIREGVYRRIPPLRRQLLHLRAAELLKGRKESSGAAARHFYLAGRSRPAHTHAMLAVSSADERLALAEGIHFLTLAINTAPSRTVKGQLHRELALRHFRTRQYRSASRHIQLAIEEPLILSVEDQAALVLLDLEILVTLGRISTNELIAHLNEVDRSLSHRQNPVIRHAVLRLLIRSAAIEGDVNRCAKHAAEMVDFSNSCGGLLAAQGLSLAARSHSYTTSFMDALPWCEQAEALILPDSDPEVAAEVLTNVGSVYYEAGQYRRALALYDKALSFIQTSGAFHIWPRTATHKHMLLVEMGHFDGARTLQSEICSAWTNDEAGQHIATLEGNVALMHLHLKDFVQTLEHARASLENASEFGLYTHRLTATALIGLAHLEMGQMSEANRCASDLLVQLATSPQRIGDFSFIEIFLARWNQRKGQSHAAIKRLELAVTDCCRRDVGGHLRMRLELASLLRRTDRKRSHDLAQDVKNASERVGASPTAEEAAFLLSRL